MSKEIAIVVKDVKKSFKIPLDGSSGIKQHVLNFYKRKKGYRTFTALDGVSFEIEKGDFFGIVGRNGSGKSTLLKMLAGVYTPDSGEIGINGSLIPFIELGVGFNHELSGRENVYLNGALLGFDRNQMDEMYDDIVEFAELHNFMEEKLKNYSSGMQVRLAFSIAIRAETDILLLDEVLAVGDEAFQKKCFQYFAELKRVKKTVILVTHDMDAVQRFCNKALMIEDGSVIEFGDPAKVARKYRELFIKKEEKGIKRQGGVVNNNIDAFIEWLRKDGKLEFDITIKPKINIDEAAVVFIINRSTGERLYRWATDINDTRGVNISRNFNIKLKLDDIFPVGDFTAGISIVNKDRTKDFAIFDNLVEFSKELPVDGHKLDINWKPTESYTIKNTQ